MNKQEAKEKIKKLIEKYDKLTEKDIQVYKEQQTKDHLFVLYLKPWVGISKKKYGLKLML